MRVKGIVMKKIKLGQGLAAVLALALIGGPVTAAVWSVTAQDAPVTAVSSAQLTVQLKTAVTQTMGVLAGRTITDSEAQSTYVVALQDVIVASGATPEVVVASLEAAMSELRAAGTLPPPAAAAIEQLLASIRAELQQGPAATGGDTGLPAFGAPPTSSAGGGGPDYGTAA